MEPIYSFIDVVALGPVRSRFAAGEALAIFSTSMDTIIWANGPGAAMLGAPNVEAAIGAVNPLPSLACRQLRAAPNFPFVGQDRAVAVRLASGFSAKPTQLLLSEVTLPDGKPALLVVFADVPKAHPEEAPLARAISGFTAENQFVAVVDAQGSILAATPGFETTGLSKEALAQFAREADRAPGHVARQRLRGETDVYPAGVARISQEPSLYLLIAIGLSEPAPEQNERAPQGEAATPAQPPVRFSWRTDANGRFTEMSPEFLEAVHLKADALIGQRFADLAAIHQFDPDSQIATLLLGRDTWSGRTLEWPVAGTNHVIPVDLAGLPVYDRARRFEGFRGFGVARVAEAFVRDNEPEPTTAESPLDPVVAPAEVTQPRAEPVPVTDAPTLEAKVVALHPSRQRTAARASTLSDSERTAFREIAARLRASEPDEALPAPVPTLSEPAVPVVEAPTSLADPTPAPETVAPNGVASELIGALAWPVIVYRGETLEFANPAFFALTGYNSLEEVARAGGLEALFDQTGSDDPTCQHLRCKTGEVRTVQAHLQTVPWLGGKALMLSLRQIEAQSVEPQTPEPPASNVTHLPLPDPSPAPVDEATAEELARTRAALAEMRAIVDTATDGVILIDAASQIRSISGPAEALFGMSATDVVGRPFTTLFAIESQRAVQDYLTSLKDHGVASVLNDGREVIGREAQGRFIPLFITIGRLPGESGFCAVVREITQWKRAEEELTHARAEAERTSSQKSAFLARVSHEIRTPLNAIIGFSELMMDERFGPIGNDRYRDYLRDINRSGTHVLDLVNDLLDISKIEAGEQELAYVAVSLNDVLTEAIAMMQPQANRERVIIRSSLASRLPDIVADMRSIRQIALNLLSNAVRYTHAGGQVIVSTAYEPSGEITLRIRDTGIGMSSAELDHALKPFKQVNALQRARGDGTGLGLPLTKAMVEANRARFLIQSRPGDGTLVEIAFPATRVLAD